MPAARRFLCALSLLCCLLTPGAEHCSLLRCLLPSPPAPQGLPPGDPDANVLPAPTCVALPTHRGPRDGADLLGPCPAAAYSLPITPSSLIGAPRADGRFSPGTAVNRPLRC